VTCDGAGGNWRVESDLKLALDDGTLARIKDSLTLYRPVIIIIIIIIITGLSALSQSV